MKQNLASKAKGVVEKSNLYFIGSDPTRLRILYLLKEHKELCVTDLAEVLDLSISAISHQLSLLERFDIVKSHRMGKTICYCLASKKDIKFNF